jgi:hypothetical protein
VLPVDLSVASWSTVNWSGIRSREDLIKARMKQLDQRTLEEVHAAEELKRARMGDKRYFDTHKRLRKERLKIGDLVLLHNTSIQKSHNVKLEDQWFGLYHIREARSSGFYRLDELDGTELRESFAANRLKKFFSRTELVQEATCHPNITADSDNNEKVDAEEGDPTEE